MFLDVLLATLSTLVVNEVLYDPEGADSGREFVEVLNTAATTVALAGLEIQVGDGARADSWQTVWRARGDSLPPMTFLVIGGDNACRNARRCCPPACRTAQMRCGSGRAV